MAPIFTATRLPSRAAPAPSGLASGLQTGQRRSLPCRAHPQVRVSPIDVSSASTVAQLHYVSGDEDDATTNRILAPAAAALASPTAALLTESAEQALAASAPCSPTAATAAATAALAGVPSSFAVTAPSSPTAAARVAATTPLNPTAELSRSSSAAAAAATGLAAAAAAAAAAAETSAASVAAPAAADPAPSAPLMSSSTPTPAAAPPSPAAFAVGSPRIPASAVSAAPFVPAAASSSLPILATAAAASSSCAVTAVAKPATDDVPAACASTCASTSSCAASAVAAPSTPLQTASLLCSASASIVSDIPIASSSATADVDITSDARSVAACSSSHPSGAKDHNSVTIKSHTNVKDAAGAVVKVLTRMPNLLVTALRMEASHEALNRAVKSIAVARKYLTDEHPGSELSFLPVNRSNASGLVDPNLFAFLCFKTQLAQGLKLLEQDKTDLNVSRGSNANAMANAIIRILKERGQAVMKAGGSEAIFIAMSAVVNARCRLKRTHNMDAMVVPAWITEDTVGTLGRESKFLRLNILPCAVNGPLDVVPA